MSASSVSSETPVHVVPSLVHLVTQWMSTVNVSCGSALSSSQVQLAAVSTAPWRAKDQCSSLVRGVGPADRTGKSVTTYCPGGTRDGSTSGRRGRPWNPREKGGMDAIVRPPGPGVIRRVTVVRSRGAIGGGAWVPRFGVPRAPGGSAGGDVRLGQAVPLGLVLAPALFGACALPVAGDRRS